MKRKSLVLEWEVGGWVEVGECACMRDIRSTLVD